MTLFAKLGEFKIAYKLEGAKDAPVMTFSNSLVCSMGMWDRVADQLKDKFRLLRYDTRGHGRSDSTPSPYSIEDLAHDVISLWDHLDIQSSHFIGLSLGGMTGINLALNHPARVISLVASDCRAEADPAYAEMFLGRVKKTKEEGMETLVEPTLARFFTPEFSTANPEVVARYAAMIRDTSEDGHNGCCMALAGGRMNEQLANLSVPTLFLGGSEDIGAPPAIMQAMHKVTPGSKHVVLEGAGHISCEETPIDYAAEIFAMVGSVDA